MNTYIIDRFEGDTAVLEGKGGAMCDVPKAHLPPEAKRGDVLVEENGVFRVDAAATRQREEIIRRKMDDLFRE